MKYYLIVGEASGDLHASHLMKALRSEDDHAEFRFFGGDMMQAVGGKRVKHYKELAYMGFIPVLLHLRTILGNMRLCKRDIVEWNPDVLILVDYPGFNLSIAQYIHAHTHIPVYYYISPKIWAWKEHRIKNIKRDVDQLFSILPFEIPFFEQKHHYPIRYVGNPTVSEVDDFLKNRSSTSDNQSDNAASYVKYGKTEKGLYKPANGRQILSLLPGSRLQEIHDNLPAMLLAAASYADRFDVVIAGAPGVSHDVYERLLNSMSEDMKRMAVTVAYGQTYPLLSESVAALVTSGTATLETALFNVPQVVCYKMSFPKLMSFLRRRFLKVKYVSLVNLIADKEVVPELVAADFTLDRLKERLAAIMPDGEGRETMLKGYMDMRERLGNERAADNAARQIIACLKG